ncbi:hypothetical protein [Nocardioides convexus]|uniref:hypothetical protein n=1 Tax=Nocardioides convexus TaxID=2712224 RepID=UPI0024185A40|nr:hypothetical protein [Nocardioides convexus]
MQAELARRRPRRDEQPRRRRLGDEAALQARAHHLHLPRRGAARHRRRAHGLPQGGQPPARAGLLAPRREGRVQGDGSAAADLGRGLPLLRHRRHGREDARSAARGRGGRALRPLRALRHHPADAGRGLARRPCRLRRLLGGVAGGGRHRPRRGGVPPAG